MTTSQSRRWAILGAPVALAAALAMGFGASAGAQDDMESHPVHIHSGTCETLGDVVFPLTNISLMGMMEGMMGGTPEADAAPMDMGEMMGAESATLVKTSYTVVDASLEEIVEGGHAINAHESTENIGNYIACGDIGGMMMMSGDEGGSLVIGLQEQNDSRHAGVAVLTAMDDQTEVVIYLVEDDGSDTGDTTEATPTS